MTIGHVAESGMDAHIRWIGIEIKNTLIFDGLSDINEFLKKYEQDVLTDQRIEAIDLVLKATPARWWQAHKDHITSWED